MPDTAELRWPLQQDVPEDTQVRKLRRVVEDLAEIVHSIEDERDLAVWRARAVLRVCWRSQAMSSERGPSVEALLAGVLGMPVVALEAVVEEQGQVERRLHKALGEARGEETRAALVEVLSWVEHRRLILGRALGQSNRRFECRAVPWHQECDFPPVVETSFVPIEGLPEHEEPHHHATSFGLARVELEHGEESEPRGVVSLFHPPAFDAPHWVVLGYCICKKSYETARAYTRGLAGAILAVLEGNKQQAHPSA
ncbi:hypothetical protein [Deinococcus aestuarii]|uniref:hypothetical protein n=1 Tax=Deinococcus aestuarii TaxID=2774531 RepID=UPI001C0C7FAF|nr:hypothetical protein [Deinococcus aestuarii]